MKKVNRLTVFMGIFLAAVFLSSCNSNQVPTTKDEVPRITVDELMERIDNGEAIVIGDTRGQGSYDVRHIAGAIPLPENQVEEYIDTLPRDKEIVLYCT